MQAAHKNGLTEHRTTMETRLEYIEGMLGDSADKHAKEIEHLSSSHAAKLADLHLAVSVCAKTDHHVTLEQRLDFLERTLGESAEQSLKEIDTGKSALESHKTSMET